MQLLCVFFRGWQWPPRLRGCEKRLRSRIWGMHRACSPWKIESSPSLAFLPWEMKNDQQRFCVGKCKKKRCIIIPQSEIPNIPGDIFPLLPHRAPHLQIPFFFLSCYFCPIPGLLLLPFCFFSTFSAMTIEKNEHSHFQSSRVIPILLFSVCNLGRNMQGNIGSSTQLFQPSRLSVLAASVVCLSHFHVSSHQ